MGTKRGFQSSHSGIETTLHGPADGLANTSNHPIVELKLNWRFDMPPRTESSNHPIVELKLYVTKVNLGDGTTFQSSHSGIET